MRRAPLALAGVLALLAGADAASPCGDKFLVIGRGARRIPGAQHRGTVLIVLPEGRAADAAREMRLEPSLRQAGHATETRATPDGLGAQIAARRPDVVVMSVADLPSLGEVVAHAPGAPVLLIVATRDDDVPAGVLSVVAPTKSVSYLSSLDAALGRRSQTAAVR